MPTVDSKRILIGNRPDQDSKYGEAKFDGLSDTRVVFQTNKKLRHTGKHLCVPCQIVFGIRDILAMLAQPIYFEALCCWRAAFRFFLDFPAAVTTSGGAEASMAQRRVDEA